MHEEAVLRDLTRKVVEVARSAGSARVVRVRLKVGALSHVTPAFLRSEWARAARGTAGEGAVVEVWASADAAEPRAQSVTLESVDLEEREPGAG